QARCHHQDHHSFPTRRSSDLASQRHTVVPLMVATTPRVTTSRCNSRNDQRASGTPAVRGLLHARRLTSTTTLGGKRLGARLVAPPPTRRRVGRRRAHATVRSR